MSDDGLRFEEFSHSCFGIIEMKMWNRVAFRTGTSEAASALLRAARYPARIPHSRRKVPPPSFTSCDPAEKSPPAINQACGAAVQPAASSFAKV